MATAPEIVGTWVDPRDDSMYQISFDEGKIAEYVEWLPTFIAAINAGVYDEWKYDIAMACHQRHLITGTTSTLTRPGDPVTSPSQITSGEWLYVQSINPVTESVARQTGRCINYKGKFYPWSRIRGKYFTAPSHFNPAIVGAVLHVVGHDENGLLVRIITQPVGPGVAAGQTIKVEFDEISDFFVGAGAR